MRRHTQTNSLYEYVACGIFMLRCAAMCQSINTPRCYCYYLLIFCDLTLGLHKRHILGSITALMLCSIFIYGTVSLRRQLLCEYFAMYSLRPKLCRGVCGACVCVMRKFASVMICEFDNVSLGSVLVSSWLKRRYSFN